MGIEVIKSGGATVSAYLKLAGGVTLSSSLVAVVDQADNVSPLQLATASAQFVAPLFLSVPAWTLGGARSNFILTSTVASAVAGANVYKMINNVYTINNTAAQTGSVTGYFLNATQITLNGITHNLMDLQVDGLSKFRVRNNNNVDIYNNSQLNWITYNGYLYHDANNFQMSTGVSILLTPFTGLVKLGGTTNAFPAIKRNGAAIDFRLADDSGYCAVNTGVAIIKGSGATSATTSLLVQNSAGTSLLTVRDDGVLTANANNCILGSISSTNITLNSGQSDFNAFAAFNNNSGSPSLRIFNDNASVSIGIGTATRIASAALFIDSTTKGFLMPRMTTAQKNAIVTPATGLMVFDTDLGKLCVFSTTWQTVTSV